MSINNDWDNFEFEGRKPDPSKVIAFVPDDGLIDERFTPKRVSDPVIPKPQLDEKEVESFVIGKKVVDPNSLSMKLKRKIRSMSKFSFFSFSILLIVVVIGIVYSVANVYL